MREVSCVVVADDDVVVEEKHCVDSFTSSIIATSPAAAAVTNARPSRATRCRDGEEAEAPIWCFEGFEGWSCRAVLFEVECP